MWRSGTSHIIITEYLNDRKGTEEDIMATISALMGSMNRNDYPRSQQLEDTTAKNNNTLEEAFPWLPKFNEIMYSAIKDKTYQNLERLIVFYTQ